MLLRLTYGSPSPTPPSKDGAWAGSLSQSPGSHRVLGWDLPWGEGRGGLGGLENQQIGQRVREGAAQRQGTLGRGIKRLEVPSGCQWLIPRALCGEGKAPPGEREKGHPAWYSKDTGNQEPVMYSRSRNSLRPPSRWLAPRAYDDRDRCYPFSPSTCPPRSRQAAARVPSLSSQLGVCRWRIMESVLLWGSLRRRTWKGDGGGRGSGRKRFLGKPTPRAEAQSQELTPRPGSQRQEACFWQQEHEVLGPEMRQYLGTTVIQ